jgi:anti-anti-sigma regulatory factor
VTNAIGDLSEVRLPERLDAGGVRAVREALGSRPGPVVILDASGVRAIEPVGALLLFRLCRELEASGQTRVRLESLAPALARRLRTHPLLTLRADVEALFHDPFDLD